MCSIGLEGWKIVSRFNYILFRFFPPREANSLDFSSFPSFKGEFFLCFSSFFSFHSNENHLNIIVIFFSSSSTCLSFHRRRFSHSQFTFIQNGWIFSFFLASVCDGDECGEIVVVDGIYGKRFLCVCMCGFQAKSEKRNL